MSTINLIEGREFRYGATYWGAGAADTTQRVFLGTVWRQAVEDADEWLCVIFRLHGDERGKTRTTSSDAWCRWVGTEVQP